MSKLYFIAVVLPEALNNEIRHFKNHMREEWGCKVALKSPAHITIIPPWWMDTEQEASLIRSAETISDPIVPFTIRLQHFSAFKPRTIFVAVQLNEPLYQLKTAADGFFSQHPVYKARPDTRRFHPHVTIATRDLHKKSFAAAWPFYETKVFERSFTASGLTILRHNQQVWDQLHTAPFSDKNNGQ